MNWGRDSVPSHHHFKTLPPTRSPRRLCPLLTSVLPVLSAQQPGRFCCQQRASRRGVLQQQPQLLQLRVSVQRGQRRRDAGRGFGQEQLRFGRCHLSGGRRGARGSCRSALLPLLELLRPGLFLRGNRAGVRLWRGAVAGLTLLLLLRGALMPGGIQGWRVFRSGLRAPGARRTVGIQSLPGDVIRESKQ